jgi:sRNA-binding protein
MEEVETLTDTQETPQPLSKTRQREQDALDLLTRLGDAFPQVFVREWGAMPKPLAIGIRDDILARWPEVDPQTIKAAMRIYFARTCPLYWRAMKAGSPRYALDGSERGTVTEEQAEQARKDLALWWERRKAKQKAQAEAKAAPVHVTPRQEAKKNAVSLVASPKDNPAVIPSASSIIGEGNGRDRAGAPDRLPIETNAPAKAARDYTILSREQKRVAPGPLTTKPFAVLGSASTAKEPPKPAIASKALKAGTEPQILVVKRGKSRVKGGVSQGE